MLPIIGSLFTRESGYRDPGEIIICSLQLATRSSSSHLRLVRESNTCPAYKTERYAIEPLGITSLLMPDAKTTKFFQNRVETALREHSTRSNQFGKNIWDHLHFASCQLEDEPGSQGSTKPRRKATVIVEATVREGGLLNHETVVADSR